MQELLQIHKGILKKRKSIMAAESECNGVLTWAALNSSMSFHHFPQWTGAMRDVRTKYLRGLGILA